MIEVLILLFIVGWITCGTLAYGYSFAHWQREYPILAERDYEIDKRKATWDFVIGPFGLFVIIFMNQTKHGFKWK